MRIQEIKDVLKKYGKDDGDVLDYSSSEFVKQFQKITDFYNKAIKNHYIYKIRESVFYVKNDTASLNARATAYRDVGLNTIWITGGFVMFLLETFTSNHEEINKQIDKTVSKDTVFLEDKLYFQYLSVFHFVIYHELAHLIQFEGDKLSYVEEFASTKDDYEHETHIFELDADEFAALSLGTHLIQYFDQVKEKGKEVKINNIADYLAISLGAIFIVMVNLRANFDQFYVDKRSHPHPITRLILLGLTMIEYLNQTYVNDNFSEKLDHYAVIDKASNYANTYNKEVKSNPVLEKVPAIIKGEFENVMKYIEKIRADAATKKNLAVQAWNNQIAKG